MTTTGIEPASWNAYRVHLAAYYVDELKMSREDAEARALREVSLLIALNTSDRFAADVVPFIA